MPFQDSTNLNHVSKYIVDANGDTPYTTIQSALDASNAEGLGGCVYVRSGTYVEDLTLYDGVGITGCSLDTTIRGNHTPPASGLFTFSDVYLSAFAGDIFASAVAGSSTLTCTNCFVTIVNGYLYDLPNWTGTLIINNCLEVSSVNGVINNTGGSPILILNSDIGVGTGNTFTASNGTVDIISSQIGCPATFGGTATVTVDEGSSLLGTVTTANTATTSITHTRIVTGVNQAITHGSANELSLSDVTIDTSNATSIGGAGAGNLQIGTITFLDNSVIAGTLTVDRTPTLTTGVVRATTEELIGSGAGAQNVIDITPAVAIGGVAWRGVDIDGAALDPTAGSSSVYGFAVDLSGVDQTNDPDLRGIDIILPATAGLGCDNALHATGFGITSMINCTEREAGFYTDSVIEQDADLTAFTAVDTGFSHLVNVDRDGSTGGDFHALDVSVTGTGTANVYAVGANPDVGVIHQHTGVFAATAQSWKFNGGYTDVTAAFDNPAVNVTIFDADNDYIYIGSNAVFSEIRVLLNTVSGRNIFPVFEYSTVGPVWVPFSPTDGTNGFTQNGIIEFDSANLAGWASVLVNGANHFYIRIQRTRNNIVTTPIEEIIRILQPTTYYWDDAGDVLAASVTAAGLADTTQGQHEIATYGASGVLAGIGPLTNGQLVIGSTGAQAVASTLTAGAGIAVTNAAGSITITNTGAAPTWSTITAGGALSVDNGYICIAPGGALSLSLPGTSAVGDEIEIVLDGATSWTVTQGAGQSIGFGIFTTTVGAGGSLASSAQGDSIRMVCSVANTKWNVISSIGNLTVT